MKKRLSLIFIIVIISFLSVSFAGELISNKITNRKDSYAVGDLVKIKVCLQLSEGERFVSIEDEKVENLYIRNKYHRISNREIDIFREYQIFSIDLKKLPDIKVKVKDKKGKEYTIIVKGKPIKIKMISKGDKISDIIPPQKGIETGWTPFPLLFIVLLLLFLIILIIVIVKRLKRKHIKEEEQKLWEKEIDPIEFFERELERIKGKNYAEKGLIKEFYYDITDVIRKFLSIYYKKNYIDKTTYEFKRDFTEEIDPILKERLVSFFEFSDLVKFAKHKPTSEYVKKAFEIAEELLKYYREIRNSILEKNDNL